MEVPTIYKIFGEQTDSSVVWQDQRKSLLRTHQLTKLVSGAVNDPILWHGTATERAQRSGVAASLSALVLMAGSSDIREHIRDIEKNNLQCCWCRYGFESRCRQDSSYFWPL